MIRRHIVTVLAISLAIVGCDSNAREDLESQVADLESQLANTQSQLAESQQKLEDAQTAMADIASKSSEIQSAVAEITSVNVQLDSENWQDVMPLLHTSIIQLDSADEDLDSSVQQGVTSVE